MKYLLFLILIMRSLDLFAANYISLYGPSNQGISLKYDLDQGKIVCLNETKNTQINNIKNAVSMKTCEDVFKNVFRVKCFFNKENQLNIPQVCIKFLKTSLISPQFFPLELVDSSQDKNKSFNSFILETYPENIFYQQEIYSGCRAISNCLGMFDKTTRKDIQQLFPILLKSLTSDELLHQIEKSRSAGNLAEVKKIIDSLRQAQIECNTKLNSLFANPVERSLAKDLLKRVKTLERDISVFHWFNGYLTVISPTKIPTLGYLYANFLKSLFYKTTEPSANFQGPGLYAAQDPISTRHYGDTLMVITLKKGSKYITLDSGSREGLKISGETYKLLNKNNCHFPHDDYYALKPRIYKDDDCSKIFNSVINKLGVNFVSYQYNAFQSSFCDKSTNLSTKAFVIFNAPIDSSTVKFYSEKIVEQRPQEHEEQMIHDLIKYFPEFKRDVPKRPKFEEYWRDRLYNCSKAYQDARRN